MKSSSAWDRTRNLPVARLIELLTAERATNCATEDLLLMMSKPRRQFMTFDATAGMKIDQSQINALHPLYR